MADSVEEETLWFCPFLLGVIHYNYTLIVPFL